MQKEIFNYLLDTVNDKIHYEQLDVFTKSHTLTLEVCSLIKNFPTDQQYLLVSQLFRSCSSIPANIAEGFGRYTIKEKVRFLYISRGSAEETKYHLLLAKDLKYITQDQYDTLYVILTEIIKMLNGLIKSIQNNPPVS